MQNSRNILVSRRIQSSVTRIAFPFAGILTMLCGLWLTCSAGAQSTYENYTFVTVAGPDNAGAGSSDGAASDARFSSPRTIAHDAQGNLYVADSGNLTVRKISPDGTVTTIAGLSGAGGTADGLGAAARFNAPYGIAVDSAGNIFVSDNTSHTIRKISPAGLVTTFAGMAGVSGTADGTGSAARFNAPNAIAVDSSNNLYVADTSNDTIRKITPARVVTTFAGSAGHPGSADKTGISATFTTPVGVAVGPDGNIYVADTGNNTIRKITPAAVVSTLAGTAGQTGTADGTNGTARFDTPFSITVDGNTNIYVVDTFNHTVRQITASGVVTTLAGSAGNPGSADNTGTNATFHFPIGITVDSNTNLFVSDFSNDAIRKINAAGVVTTFAGFAGGPGSVDAMGGAARFNFPSDIAFDGSGNAFITDVANNTIREMTPDGNVTTLAGLPGQSGTNDGVGNVARFFNPFGLTVDTNGNIFVADTQNDTIRKIDPLGSVSTFAGFALNANTNDGIGTAARFRLPIGITMDTNGNFFVADTHNQTIREITPAGSVTTVAGVPGSTGTNDGPALSAQFHFPEGLDFDGNGNLYVVDDDNSTIRKIAPDGSVTTFAGTAGLDGSADATGAAARFFFPFGLATDSSGNVYVADTDNDLIRKITPAGVVTTLGGTAGKGGSLDGTGSDARFGGPEGLAVDQAGNIYVADAGNHSIRKGYPSLSDSPTVDLIGANVGVTRHLSVTNLTTTTWSWTLIRRPASSTAQLSATNTANPTFTPDVEDVYTFRFQGWDNSGKTAIKTLTLYADNTAPSVAITNPIAGQISSNGVFTAKGTAADNLGVSSVWVQASGGDWVNASLSGANGWSANVSLSAGTNVIRAYAVDFAGNVSQTNEAGLFYVVSAPLSVTVNGPGTVTPNLNNQLLEIGKVFSMTAKAGTGGAFVNWSGDISTNAATITFVMQSNLNLTANFTDIIKPTIIITTPKLKQNWSNSVFMATGTAKDNGSVASVQFQLNGGAWAPASGTTNWTASLSLVPGTNVFRAYAVDTSANVSTTNTVSFVFIVSGQATVLTTGQGTLTPNYNNATLQIGKNYTMAAKAATGSIFSNWVNNVGATLSTRPSYTFTMQSNQFLQANFIPNPFTPAVGTYAGLFYDTNNVTATNAGFFSATVTSLGGFTAKITLGAATVSVIGQFTAGGTYSNSIAVNGSSPIVLQLQVDLAGGNRMTGSVSSGWNAQLLANRAVYSAANPPPQAGKKYTLVIPGGDDSSLQPGGNGYGTISVDGLGNITFAGVLADTAIASQKTFVSGQGQWPIFVSLPYKGQGLAIGWLSFADQPNSDISGLVYWMRQAQAAAKVYKGGFNFTNGVEAVGSLYGLTNGVPLLNLPAGGMVVLQQQNPSVNITNNFTLGANNTIVSTNGLTGTITTTTGALKLSVHNPAGGTAIPANGVLLQKQNSGFGFYVTTNGQSGSLYFGP